jgi:hypothetical protein
MTLSASFLPLRAAVLELRFSAAALFQPYHEPALTGFLRVLIEDEQAYIDAPLFSIGWAMVLRRIRDFLRDSWIINRLPTIPRLFQQKNTSGPRFPARFPTLWRNALQTH